MTIFIKFYEAARASDIGRQMAQTIEGSEWHREESVWIHTEMCLVSYNSLFAPHRTERQRLLTRLCLLFHDFGKPAAEVTLPRKDGSGTYHRYAGHEPVSSNEFISFCCDHPELMAELFEHGFDWSDVRKIKLMIEQHLPFGLKNKTKREELRSVLANTLGDDQVCFYDQLVSDCYGRISDDHDSKKRAVHEWILEFKAVVPKAARVATGPVLYVLTGASGAGKSTYAEATGHRSISEDAYRLSFAGLTDDDPRELYARSWQYCYENSKEYDRFVKTQYASALSSGTDLILDRTNQTRKSRRPWITAATAAGYRIHGVELYVSKAVSLARQDSRSDKSVPTSRAALIHAALETCWLGVEVDTVQVLAQ